MCLHGLLRGIASHIGTKLTGSTLGPDTGYLDWSFMWVYSVALRNFRDKNKPAWFQTLCYLSFSPLSYHQTQHYRVTEKYEKKFIPQINMSGLSSFLKLKNAVYIVTTSLQKVIRLVGRMKYWWSSPAVLILVSGIMAMFFCSFQEFYVFLFVNEAST
jgi:hypothetical protein